MRRFFRVLLDIRAHVMDSHVGLLAAGVAFYGVLALFPAIAAVLAIGGLVLDAAQIIDQLNGFEGFVPQDVLSIVRVQAIAVADASDAGLGATLAFSIALALWSSSRGVAGLVQGLNVVSNCKETRGFFRLNTRIYVMTGLLIVGFLFGLGALVLLPAIQTYVDLGAVMAPGLTALRWGLVLLFSLTSIAVLYRFGPAERGPWRWISAGNVVACLVWILASSGFTYYASQVTHFNESFSALGGVVVLILWLWLLAFALLLGACVNHVLDKH